MTFRSSPLGLGMEIRRLASSTISSLSTFTRSGPPTTDRTPFGANGKAKPALRSRRADLCVAGQLESFEAGNFDDEDDRPAYLDLEIFWHVEQTRLQSGRVGHRNLGTPATGTPKIADHVWHLIVFDADEQAGVPRTEERTSRADFGEPVTSSHKGIGQSRCVLVLNNGDNELHWSPPL